LMVGTGSAVRSEFGFLIAATQAIANIPGGFAATSNFRDDGMECWKRLMLSASMALPALISAGAGFSVMRVVNADIQSAALAFFVGILLLATIEDVIPEADAPKPPRSISTGAFAGGFAMMALLSGLLQ